MPLSTPNSSLAPDPLPHITPTSQGPMMPRPGLPQQHCAGRAMPADSLGVLPQLCPNEPGQSPLCLGFICDMGVRAPISAESCEDQTHPESHMPPGQGRPWSAADPTTRLDGATHGARRGASNGLPHPPHPPQEAVPARRDQDLLPQRGWTRRGCCLHSVPGSPLGMAETGQS